jgi:hypothetical protein
VPSTVNGRYGFKLSQVAFVTAYRDRESARFKKTVAGSARGSFHPFVLEPDQIIVLRDGSGSPDWLWGPSAAANRRVADTSATRYA